ncbi:hypothetical protein [Actinomadura sp. NEAU-AAG7]|uniref:hypothetical protein n=1 Tax=Actinomadura sp. NEAU-AAG7 TaxID=2839640 RepID=UPI001BE4CA1F|nr:hypothetical protein [Actinomadura sp. NEAU-AAG7]MBT2212659.1 hypothetical protein [Actinomadura sp. NEAU-AAG7]
MPGTDSYELDIHLTTTRDVPQEDMRHAREVVVRALAYVPRPILFAKATLSVLPDPAVPRPHLVHFQADLNGMPVNAHAAAATMPEAIALAGVRLRTRAENITRRPEHHKAHRHPQGDRNGHRL